MYFFSFYIIVDSSLLSTYTHTLIRIHTYICIPYFIILIFNQQKKDINNNIYANLALRSTTGITKNLTITPPHIIIVYYAHHIILVYIYNKTKIFFIYQLIKNN